MKMTMTQQRFVDALCIYEKADWTYEEAKALFEYYEEEEASTGIEKEFNRHDIGCTWSSSTPLELWNEYSHDEPYSLDGFEEWVNDKTVCIWLDSGRVLYQYNF